MFTLTCMAAELARAVSLASQVAGNPKQLNILKSCMIEVSDGKATIAATDMDHAVRVTLAGEGNGTVFIDTAMLAQKSAALRPNVPVILSGDDPAFVMMVQGKTKWKIPVINEAEHKQFPVEITQPLAGEPLEIGGAMFVNAMSAASGIVRQLATNNAINMGIFLDTVDGFRAIGADTRGLFVVQMASEPLPVSIIVPSNAISVIGNMFRAAETLSVVATADALAVSADGVMYRTKLVDQGYADWRKAHTAQTASLNGSAIVDAAHISEVVRRATAIAEEKGKDGASLAVTLTFADGECSASAKNRNGEEGVDYCPADGDDGVAKVNAGVLLDAISSLDAERLLIRFNTEPDSVSAIVVEPYPEIQTQNFRVVMPRRI